VLRTLMSSILGAAVDDGLLAKNPTRARSVKAPAVDRRRIESWSPEQVAAVRAALPARFRAMADCGAGLGMRQGEVFGLAVGDVDFLRRTVTVRRQVKRVGSRLVFGPPKGGKQRQIPLPESVALALAEHISGCPPGTVTLPWQAPGGKPATAGLLFTSPGGERRALDRNNWNTFTWRPAVRSAGLPAGRDSGYHQLRHYYASTLLAAGVDVRTLAEALGHADPGFTLRVYTHLMPDSADRIRQAIDGGTAAADGTTTARQTGNLR
jgi:integrase